MATQTLSLSQPYGNRSAVLCTLARQKAIKVIKREFQAQGLRLAHFSAREIHIRADAYFEAHRQTLIAEAMETVRKSPHLRTLYEREQCRLGEKLATTDAAPTTANRTLRRLPNAAYRQSWLS